MPITRADYQQAFAIEAARAFPVLDALEVRLGYALSPSRYLPAAEVLACAIKKTKTGRLRDIALWQHGRLLYAVARELFSLWGVLPSEGPVTTLDIGTAKGYSALCVQWALDDAGVNGTVHSVDVLDPLAPVERHTIAEVDGLKPLADFLAPWPEARRIHFHQSTGIAWLERFEGRLPFVYVDGKHTEATVLRESALIRAHQQPGDVTVFDDVQIQGVADALRQLKGYELEYIEPRPDRRYAIARRV
jgi:predicted O-methyltransferase YrrM